MCVVFMMVGGYVLVLSRMNVWSNKAEEWNSTATTGAFSVFFGSRRYIEPSKFKLSPKTKGYGR